MRFLVHPSAPVAWEVLESPVVVVGGGVAGLSAAIEVGRTRDVLLLTKAWLSDCATEWAQGGVAAAVGPEDTLERHYEDTMSVGCGLSDPVVVRAVVEGGPEALERLMRWGGQFDRATDGRLSLGMEGGHSAERVVHAMGDRTGREIQRVLVGRARAESRIRILEHAFVLDLLKKDGRVVGVLAWVAGRFLRIHAGGVILATGGAGHVYRETTNPEVATGDGHAILLRAGATVRGMEFVQFHPTTLYIAGSSRTLISEAARGEGAVLRDSDGVPFMDDLHPRGSLAPRDFVSRAVLDRMVKTGRNVFLDLTHLDPAFVRERFPRIHQVCLGFGVDITKAPIPVAPAAHYFIGGAAVDLGGRTNLPGLWAVGEVTCSGLHGANRLASNSLLEGLVLGHRAGQVVVREGLAPCLTFDEEVPPEPLRRDGPHFHPMDLLNSLQSIMWREVGLLRNEKGLAKAATSLREWFDMTHSLSRPQQRDWELLNLLQVGRAVTHAAEERRESRGVHFRSDHPESAPGVPRDLELIASPGSELKARWVTDRGASATQSSGTQSSGTQSPGTQSPGTGAGGQT